MVTMEEKHVDPRIQLDVDEMILDYLLFTTTRSILEHQEKLKENRDDARNNNTMSMLMQLVDSYLIMFHAIHPGLVGDENIRLRLRLLKFTIMFTNRSGPKMTAPSATTMKGLREKRRNQASSFRSGDESLVRDILPDLTKYFAPSDASAIKEEQMSPNASPTLIDPATAHPRPSLPPVSLLDTLPAFMALSAAQTAVQGANITDVWMHLAGGYMVQAVAEQYLLYGSRRADVLQEAFAWGFDADCDADEGSDEWQINAMFFGEDEVVNGWDGIRDKHMGALIPSEGISLEEHLKTLLEGDLSTVKFEQYIISFLTGLHLSQPSPILIQVESRKMDALSWRAMRAFHKAVGLS